MGGWVGTERERDNKKRPGWADVGDRQVTDRELGHGASNRSLGSGERSLCPSGSGVLTRGLYVLVKGYFPAWGQISSGQISISPCLTSRSESEEGIVVPQMQGLFPSFKIVWERVSKLNYL